MSDFSQKAQMLVTTGSQLYAMGMVPATSGNLSARLENGNIAITVSGRHKGHLQISDIMQVDSMANPLEDKQPSAETLLHCQIYNRFNQAQFVLHPHSINSTLLSKRLKGHLCLQDYELLKALTNVRSHEQQVTIPLFPNTQNISRLVNQLEQYLQQNASIVAYLIVGHGFYTWANTLENTMKHVEALEFLFRCELNLRGNVT